MCFCCSRKTTLGTSKISWFGRFFKYPMTMVQRPNCGPARARFWARHLRSLARRSARLPLLSAPGPSRLSVLERLTVQRLDDGFG